MSLHSAGILHGDVGITNVLVSEGKAILYEFSMSVQQDWGFEKDVLDFGITIAEVGSISTRQMTARLTANRFSTADDIIMQYFESSGATLR